MGFMDPSIASTKLQTLSRNLRSKEMYHQSAGQAEDEFSTGLCFANAEMNVTGKEGILVWSVREGNWRGTSLGGLSVIAVVCTDGTLGDVRYQPRAGKAVLIVDENADAAQRQALSDLARSLAGNLIKQ